MKHISLPQPHQSWSCPCAHNPAQYVPLLLCFVSPSYFFFFGENVSCVRRMFYLYLYLSIKIENFLSTKMFFTSIFVHHPLLMTMCLFLPLSAVCIVRIGLCPFVIGQLPLFWGLITRLPSFFNFACLPLFLVFQLHGRASLHGPFYSINIPVKHKEFNTCWSEVRKHYDKLLEMQQDLSIH
jgi:hypothetical protein